jgi:hypothetical protein
LSLKSQYSFSAYHWRINHFIKHSIAFPYQFSQGWKSNLTVYTKRYKINTNTGFYVLVYMAADSKPIFICYKTVWIEKFLPF